MTGLQVYPLNQVQGLSCQNKMRILLLYRHLLSDMAKKRNDRRGIVYSTDPDFEYQPENNEEEETLEPSLQKLVVRIDRRQRKGKEVTLVEGFVGHPEDLKALGKRLKNHCGVGGAVKNGQILLQGDHRDKVLAALQKDGYRVRRGN